MRICDIEDLIFFNEESSAGSCLSRTSMMALDRSQQEMVCSRFLTAITQQGNLRSPSTSRTWTFLLLVCWLCCYCQGMLLSDDTAVCRTTCEFLSVHNGQPKTWTCVSCGPGLRVETAWSFSGLWDYPESRTPHKEGCSYQYVGAFS